MASSSEKAALRRSTFRVRATRRLKVSTISGASSESSLTTTGSSKHSLLREASFQVIEPPESEYTTAVGINALKQIVGTWDDADGVTRGYLLKKGRFTPIAYPGAVSTTANRINIFGQIVGTWGLDPARHMDTS